MSKWITNRLPKKHEQTIDGEVWIYDAGEYVIRNIQDIAIGTPWCEIHPPDDYKPYYVGINFTTPDKDEVYKVIYYVYHDVHGVQANNLPTKEAAERVAAIYNEVML